jgi:hypothetical protein
VPDHSTLSRRSRTLAVASQAASGPVHLLVDSTGVKLSGPGEWLVDLHPVWRTPQQARYDPGGGEGWQ